MLDCKAEGGLDPATDQVWDNSGRYLTNIGRWASLIMVFSRSTTHIRRS